MCTSAVTELLAVFPTLTLSERSLRGGVQQLVKYIETLVPPQAPRRWHPSLYDWNAALSVTPESNKRLIISPDNEAIQEPDKHQLILARGDMDGQPVNQGQNSRHTNRSQVSYQQKLSINIPYRNILIKYRVQETINSPERLLQILMSTLIRQLITGIYQSLFKTWRQTRVMYCCMYGNKD